MADGSPPRFPSIGARKGLMGLAYHRRVALLDVILGYDCNLFCDYCTITPEMRGRSLAAGTVAAELSRGRADGYDEVSFTGGEPTMRPDLLPLVRRARELGYRGIKIQTNGLLLAEPRNLERLLAAGATRVHLSIQVHREEAYDRLVRREGTFPLMVAALDALVASGVVLVADVILEEETYRELTGAVRWLHARGVRTVHLWFVSLTDQNRENVASMPRMTDVVPFMAEAFAFARESGMEVRSLHVPRCLLGDDAPHAWDPGSDRVRVVTPDATFDLSESRLAGQLHVPACEGCAFREICPGIREDYLARFGDSEIVAARRLPGEPSPA